MNSGETSSTSKNLWENLLDSVGKRSRAREGHLLLLGDHDAGKRSLLKAMNKPFLKTLGIPVDVFDDYGSNYAPFESSFLYVHDSLDYSEAALIGQDEPLSRLNVWIISEEEMGYMIDKIIRPEDLEYTFAIIVPNLEQPWNLYSHCKKWMKILTDAIYRITPHMNYKVMERLRERIVNLYKTYTEPEFDKDGKYINKKIKNRNREEDPDDS